MKQHRTLNLNQLWYESKISHIEPSLKVLLIQNVIKEYFEGSTIHGLSYLVQGVLFSKVFWAVIIVIAVSTESYLIGSAFLEWENDPVGTTLITLPISRIKFPKVTVCPAQGSNTALNYDLMEAGQKSLDNATRKTLEDEVEKIFVHDYHTQRAEILTATVNPPNIPYLLDGTLELGGEYDVKMTKIQGTITSPNFATEVKQESVKQDYNLRYKIILPENVKSLVGDGKLSVEVISETSGDLRVTERLQWRGPRLQLHREQLSWKKARRVCQEDGGDLASFQATSDWEPYYRFLQGEFSKTGRVWLGGNDISEELQWRWSDGSPWDLIRVSSAKSIFYKGYGKNEGDDGEGQNCLSVEMADSPMLSWLPFFNQGYDDACEEEYPFVCSLAPSLIEANSSLRAEWNAEEMLFDCVEVWWSHTVSSWSLLDTEHQRMTGFQLKWGVRSPPKVQLEPGAETAENGRLILRISK